MPTSADFLLAAENCTTAALASTNHDERLEYLLQSVVWRNEALRLRLGSRASMLTADPFADDRMMSGQGCP